MSGDPNPESPDIFEDPEDYVAPDEHPDVRTARPPADQTGGAEEQDPADSYDEFSYGEDSGEAYEDESA